MKQIHTRFLILVALVSLMSSCGEQPSSVGKGTDSSVETTPSATEQSTAPTSLEQLEKHDFNGAVYSIIYGDDYDNMYPNLPSEELEGDIRNDALAERGYWIEDFYNVTLQYETVGTADMNSRLKKSAASGDNAYNLSFSGAASSYMMLSNSGVLANMREIKELCLDEPWWCQYVTQNMTLNGKLFFTSGDIVPAMYDMLHCLYLNKRLLDDYDFKEDYYQIVRDGKWTLDKLGEIAIGQDRDLNSDGKLMANDDFFGFASIKGASSFLVGCGEQYSTLKNGMVEVDLDIDAISTKLTAIQKLIPDFTYAAARECLYAFAEDRAIVTNHLTCSAAVWFRDMKSDFMILPYPKYTEEQESYVSCTNVWTPGFVGIPLLADSAFTGAVTEALARYSYEIIRPQIYQTIMKDKTSRDMETGEMLDIIFNSAYLDFNLLFDFGKTLTVIENVILNGDPLASKIAAAQSAANADIAALVEKWK